MQHLYDLEQVQLQKPSLVTIGVFDGVHRGHQHLIRSLVEAAWASDRLVVVLTFFPHPDVVLRGLSGRYYLTTPEQRADYLGALGVDTVITLPFNEAFRKVRAATFVDLMIEHLKLSSLWVGADFAMGYKREGNVDFLREQGAAKGFDLQVLDLLSSDGDGAISSTAIRAALLAGELDQACDWLGRSYALTGEVVHGDHRGRELGYPTANIHIWDEQVIPANGIYAGWAHLGDQRFMAATSVGVRPQFDGEDVRVEAYLLDFDRMIYGQQLTFTFEKYLRPEMRFDGIDSLIAQIAADVEETRRFLSATSAR